MKHKHHKKNGFSMISLIVVIAAGIFLGIGAYIMSKGTTYSPFSSRLLKAHVTPAEDLKDREVSSTIPDIIGHGQDLECDIKVPYQGPENPFRTGTLWTTANKGRSTLTATVSKLSIEANAVYQNNTAYTWIIMGSQKMGMKFSPERLSEADRSLTTEQRQQAEQIRASMLFNCHAWTPDETKFVLPSDVEFEEK